MKRGRKSRKKSSKRDEDSEVDSMEDEENEEEEEGEGEIDRDSIPTPESISQSIFTLQTHDDQTGEDEEVDKTILKSKFLKTRSQKELTQNLKKMLKALKSIGQLDENDDLPYDETLPSALIRNNLLNSVDEKISIFLANCIVDILRITVSVPTYNHLQLKKIFHFFVAQLAKLKEGESPLNEHRFYLLERLATVNMFALLCSEDVDGAEEICENCVANFYKILKVRKEIPPQMLQYMVDILTAIFDGFDGFGGEFVEMALKPLHQKKGKSVNLHQVVEKALKRSSEMASGPICNYLKERLASSKKRQIRMVKRGKKSEKKKEEDKRHNLYTTIFELNLISSKYMLHILPILLERVTDENNEVRSDAISLLGIMFSNEKSKLVSEYVKGFEIFCGRFNDNDHRIRKYMCKVAYEILMNHYQYAMNVPPLMRDKLQDPHELVRVQCIKSFASLLIHKPEIIDESVMELLTQRCRDRKPKVRLLTMERLSLVYKRMKEIKNGEEDWEEEMQAKFDWIPLKILDYYCDTSCSFEEKLKIEEFVIENIMPTSLVQRSRRLVEIYTNVKEGSGKNSFETFLTQKTQYRKAVKSLFQEVLDEEEEDMSDEEDEDDEKKKRKRTAKIDISRKTKELTYLCAILGEDYNEGDTFWKNLILKSDFNELYEIIISCCSDESNMRSYTKGLKKGKSAGKKNKKIKKNYSYFANVLRRLSENFVSAEEIFTICEHSKKFILLEEYELSMQCLELVKTVSSIMPQTAFVDSFGLLCDILEVKGDDVNLSKIQNVCLQILAKAGEDLEILDHKVARKLKSILFDYCWNGISGEAKYASIAISRIFTAPVQLLNEVIPKMIKKFSSYSVEEEDKDYLIPIIDTLYVLSENQELSHELISKYDLRIIDFILNKIVIFDDSDDYMKRRTFVSQVEREKDEKTTQATKRSSSYIAFHDPSIFCRIQKKSIKLLISVLKRLNAEDNLEAKEPTERVFQFFHNILEVNGDLQRIDNESKKVKEKDEDEEEEDEFSDEEDEGKVSDGAAHLLLSIFKAFLILSKPQYDQYCDVNGFLKLAYLVTIPHKHFRRKLCRTLSKKCLKLLVDIKFGALLFLCVGDDDQSNSFYARTFVRQYVNSLRKMIEQYKTSLSMRSYKKFKASQSESDDEEEKMEDEDEEKEEETMNLNDPRSRLIYPEYVLPPLILLLSHYPDFSDYYPHFNKFQKILFAYFDEVTKNSDNYSFFHEMIQKIKVRKDILVEGDHKSKNNSQIICDLSMEVCNKATKSLSYQLKFPGKISIPGYFVKEGDMKDNRTHLYLPGAFRINEKKNRDFKDPLQKEKTAMLKEKRSRKRKRNVFVDEIMKKEGPKLKKRKKLEEKKKAKEKKKREKKKKRKRKKRSKKVKRKYKKKKAKKMKDEEEEEEEESEEEEKESEEEEEPPKKKKRRGGRKKKKMVDEEKSEESEEEEDKEEKPKRKRGRKRKAKKMKDEESEEEEEEEEEEPKRKKGRGRKKKTPKKTGGKKKKKMRNEVEESDEEEEKPKKKGKKRGRKKKKEVVSTSSDEEEEKEKEKPKRGRRKTKKDEVEESDDAEEGETSDDDDDEGEEKEDFSSFTTPYISQRSKRKLFK